MLVGAATTQLYRKGAPVVFGVFASSMSMQSGAPTFGTPEPSLVIYGAAQLARRLGIPFRSGGGLCASKMPDAQAAYESAQTMDPTLLAGTNFVLHAAGWLEGGLVSSFAKFVMDADQCAMYQRLANGIDLSENGQALDAIAEVRTKYMTHFLDTEHTRRNFEDGVLPLHRRRQQFVRAMDGGRRKAHRAEGHGSRHQMAGGIRGTRARSGHRRGAEGVHRQEEGGAARQPHLAGTGWHPHSPGCRHRPGEQPGEEGVQNIRLIGGKFSATVSHWSYWTC